MTDNLQRTANDSKFVTFRLGRQAFGLPVEPVVQIIPMLTITHLPEMGDSVAGVINVRGQAVPVIDMRRHIGLTQAPVLLHTPIILMRMGSAVVGLMVDHMLDVLTVPQADLILPGSLLPQGMDQPAVLQGLAHLEDELVLLLTPEHLFKPEERRALARAAEMLPGLEQAGSLPPANGNGNARP